MGKRKYTFERFPRHMYYLQRIGRRETCVWCKSSEWKEQRKGVISLSSNVRARG